MTADDDPNLARWNATLRGPVRAYKASRGLPPLLRLGAAGGATPRAAAHVVAQRRLSKAQLAAPKCLCCYPLRVAGQLVPLRERVRIALCTDHRDPAFLISRGGRDFAASLAETFRSLGLDGARYQDAARALVADAAAMLAPTPRHRPGSYAWPHLRRAAEEIWAAGGSYHAGEARLLDLHEPFREAVLPPSRQTVRRWWRERRWLTPRPSPRLTHEPVPLEDHRPLVVLERPVRHPRLAGSPYRAPGTPPDAPERPPPRGERR